METIRLTETMQKGGCAAKIPAGQLRQILSGLDLPRPQELLVGIDTLDDACLWDLGDERLLVQTLDFFTPIVDDPRDFGAIAAANALSDVYAMGGSPKTAMTILCFPSANLPMELVAPLMEGALSKIREAGACLAGGHSIDDETLKLGFSVSGFVNKKSVWTNAGAQTGDALILTKGLGTGTITSGLKSKKAKAEWVQAAIKSMTTLNATGSALNGIEVHAATDITGFGLAGHAIQMAEASGKRFLIQVRELPTIAGALESLDQKIINRAHRTNGDYVKDRVAYGDVNETLRLLTLDPQTSGGLLLAIPTAQAEAAIQALCIHFPNTRRIGEVVERGSGAPALSFS